MIFGVKWTESLEIFLPVNVWFQNLNHLIVFLPAQMIKVNKTNLVPVN